MSQIHEEADLIHLVYVSRVINDFTNYDLKAILNSSNRNNLRLNITGILVYGGGRVMQFLEGSEFNVLKLFSVIKKDYRHHGVDIVRQNKIANRQYNDWQMRLTHPDEISENTGIIYNKLFDKKKMSEDDINLAVESRTWLLAFKHAC